MAAMEPHPSTRACSIPELTALLDVPSRLASSGLCSLCLPGMRRTRKTAHIHPPSRPCAIGVAPDLPPELLDTGGSCIGLSLWVPGLSPALNGAFLSWGLGEGVLQAMPGGSPAQRLSSHSTPAHGPVNALPPLPLWSGLRRVSRALHLCTCVLEGGLCG